MRMIFLASLVLCILTSLWGCGGGGGGGNAVTPAASKTFSTGASVSLVPLGNGQYSIQGDKLDGVAGMEMTFNYDNATMSSPAVVQGNFISGALMMANTSSPGIIRMAIVAANPFAGGGTIATVSFASHTGPATMTIGSVQLANVSGQYIQ